MEVIAITHRKVPTGFGKSVEKTLEGVIFTNGKVAYVDEEGMIQASDTEDNLKKFLGSHGTVSVTKVKHKKHKHDRPA